MLAKLAKPMPQQQRKPPKIERERLLNPPNGVKALETIAKSKLDLYKGSWKKVLIHVACCRDAAAAKSAEAARKKAERAALEAEEMSNLKSAKAGNSKTAQKKNPNRELDLSQLEANDQPSSKKTTLNATGIDDALDALSLTNGANESLDRHPERRFKAAYNAFESRRLEEMKDDKTLRRQQKIEQIRKEFEKSPENPFNQVNVKYNTTTKEISNIKEQEKDKTESRLANNPSG